MSLLALPLRQAALLARLAGQADDRGRKGPLLADGSTGSALEDLAPSNPERIALLPLEEPALVESLHRAYLEAGSELVETASFQASALGLAPWAAQGIDLDGRLSHNAIEIAYRVNLAAASLARRAADSAEASSGQWRYVAGSIGPGDRPPSLGASSWAELKASYLPQARGLAEGGCDLAIVETCQDPLQIKAALAALADPQGGRGLPALVSATVDNRGLLLAGTDLGALVAIIAPFRPLALGLNCSGGPAELGASLSVLARLSPLPLSFMPNAGLPRESGGKTVWPLGAAEFGPLVAGLAKEHGVALVGGCCGTKPEHIAALARALGTAYEIPPRPAATPGLASLYGAKPFGPGLFRIGERANAAGSAAFAALVLAGDFDGAAARAVLQEANGAQALDLHVSRPGRDEGLDLGALVGRLGGLARAALCLDSGDPEVLAQALPLVGGRPLLNSTSLEDPGRARRVFGLARDFGAAVVCLAMDAQGPAKTAVEKARICRALYDIGVGEFGLEPSSLLFDPLTFTVAAGPPGAAAQTLEALGLVKAACPGSLTVLGVGNVSYGLPKVIRPAVTSVFLGLAREAGLDAAIMDCGGIPDPGSVDPAIARAARALILGLTEEGYDPLAVLLETGLGPTLAAGPATQAEEALDPARCLERALLKGDRRAALKEAERILTQGGPTQLAEAVGAAMAESGRLWSRGDLPLPLVLRAAESARAALELLGAGGGGEGRGTVVMATVKGDLHDIGKNIAGAILACSGYRVVDLGTDVPAARIVEAAVAEAALAVGLSGLLTRSLAEMRTVCEALVASGSRAFVLAGGATVDASWCSRVLGPILGGRVGACADAFEGLAHLKGLEAGMDEVTPLESFPLASTSPSSEPRVVSPIAPAPRAAFVPPFEGSRILELSAQEVFAHVDRASLFHARWGYRKSQDARGREGGFAEAEEELERLKALVLEDGLLEARAAMGFFPCHREGEDCLVVEDPTRGGRAHRFVFPATGAGLSVAHYYCGAGDIFPAFAVTVGRPLGLRARDFRDSGRVAEYWRLHGLGSALAEAAADLVHASLGDLIEAAGASRGKRYSFGFAHCPGLESQGGLLELLGADRAGIGLTGGFQLDPEHSVTAIIVAREDARYF